MGSKLKHIAVIIGNFFKCLFIVIICFAFPFLIVAVVPRATNVGFLILFGVVGLYIVVEFHRLLEKQGKRMTICQWLRFYFPLLGIMLLLIGLVCSFFNASLKNFFIIYASGFSAIAAFGDFAGFIASRYENNNTFLCKVWNGCSIFLVIAAFIVPLLPFVPYQSLFPSLSSHSRWNELAQFVNTLAQTDDTNNYTLFTLGIVVIVYSFRVMGAYADKADKMEKASQSPDDNRGEAPEKAVDKKEKP